MKTVRPFFLQPYHTMATPHSAAEGLFITSEEELPHLRRRLRAEARPYLVLGAGSNLFFRRDFEGIVVLNRIGGRQMVAEAGDEVIVEVGAGEPWPAVVEAALADKLYGIENLALIPGRVGAAPIQNIGAYGRELADVLEYVHAYNLESGESIRWTPDQCRLGYRTSIFKSPEWRRRLVITRVALRLSRRPRPEFRYRALQDYFAERNIPHPTPEQVFRAVVEIRTAKLPDPARLPNAGSFFKNPVVSNAQWKSLRRTWPRMPGWPMPEGGVKVPAAWLIEHAGWKGRRIGGVGTHPRQPLVIVNYERRPGEEVHRLAMEIREAVEERFGIRLDPEVEMVE